MVGVIDIIILYHACDCITPLLCKLHWLPICFQVQVKVSVTINGIDQGYLVSFLVLLGQTHPTSFGRESLLRILLIKELWLSVSRKRVFSATAPTLCWILLSWAKSAPTSYFSAEAWKSCCASWPGINFLGVREGVPCWKQLLDWGQTPYTHPCSALYPSIFLDIILVYTCFLFSLFSLSLYYFTSVSFTPFLFLL